jgi:hypothetical protein
MKISIAFSAMAWALACSITACSTSRPSDAEYAQRLAIFRDNAGAPGLAIPRQGRSAEWMPLGDEALTLWPSQGEGYLVEFMQSCPSIKYLNNSNHDYDALGLISERAQIQIAAGDRIQVRNNGQEQFCYIKTIQPLDEKSLAEQMQTLPRQGGLLDLRPVALNVLSPYWKNVVEEDLQEGLQEDLQEDWREEWREDLREDWGKDWEEEWEEENQQEWQTENGPWGP